MSVTASESSSGNESEIHAPTYGMKRSKIASRPHRKRVGHPDEVEPGPDEHAAKIALMSALHRQVAGNLVARLVERLGGHVDPAPADEVDDAVAQVLVLDEHEQYEHEDDRRRAQRADHRADGALEHVIETGGGLDDLHLRDLVLAPGKDTSRAASVAFAAGGQTGQRLLGSGAGSGAGFRAAAGGDLRAEVLDRLGSLAELGVRVGLLEGLDAWWPMLSLYCGSL